MHREAEIFPTVPRPGRKEPVAQLLIFTSKLLLKLSITGLKTNVLPAYAGLTYPATGVTNRLVLPGCPERLGLSGTCHAGRKSQGLHWIMVQPSCPSSSADL